MGCDIGRTFPKDPSTVMLGCLGWLLGLLCAVFGAVWQISFGELKEFNILLFLLYGKGNGGKR
jgi:hypothetical protein